ncbi:hypothetical protein HYPSUDRAFT_46681 [Hypholoma sublateritium FD-334 SS-4]|uniref:Extracellular membrane protein CFEM domain-containing protein n=1 Tax=Hypholoma sublateritium (strain FD-334 SS-4) TaxID=945553 RepID=A0A0D2KR82_HYPSF|nr:hypothetical protein HYPSUDRAFT_46681 [Hypholoma sublateritium FD-334 SS-4]
MFALLFVAFFAAHALAQFSVSFNNVGMTALEILAIPASPVATACGSNLTETTGLFTACNNDPQCLCNSASVTSFVNTETCMFNELIRQNVKSPSPLAGSNVLVGAYAAACAANNITVPAAQSALVVPPGWDGPYVAVLSTGPTVVVVGVGAILGLSALYILSNLE